MTWLTSEEILKNTSSYGPLWFWAFLACQQNISKPLELEPWKLILVTLTPFSRSQEGLDCWKKGCSLLSALCRLIEWTDFGQTYTNISLGEGKILNLVTLTPFSQEGLDCWKMGWSLLSSLYLLIDWTDFSQTYSNISLGGGNLLIRYWWPWSDFQGHRRA